MEGYVANIEDKTQKNKYFRKVLFTGPHLQLVVMSLKPGEEIGEEVHDLDQFICFEEGGGTVVMGDKKRRVEDDYGVIVPAGTRHNVINRSKTKALKLFTVYSRPEHEPGTIHRTKKAAEKAEKEQ